MRELIQEVGSRIEVDAVGKNLGPLAKLGNFLSLPGGQIVSLRNASGRAHTREQSRTYDYDREP